MTRSPQVPPGVQRTLEALYDAHDPSARIPHDPVQAVHRYQDRADREVAGFLAAGLAFGRVDLFLPVLDRLLDRLDSLGGPSSAARAWTPGHDAGIADLTYRWIRTGDLAILVETLGRALRESETLEQLLGAPGPWQERLSVGIDRLRGHALDALDARGRPGAALSDLPRGVRTFLPSPRDGSACKRLNLWVRWMVRPPIEGVDAGLWHTVSTADLVIPVDVHVGRLARFLGLTARPDASWRTAREITEALATLDPEDPVRFDFAMAHHGISRACLGRREATVCATCVLDAVCRAPRHTSTASPAQGEERTSTR